jgi:hypothetical protein
MDDYARAELIAVIRQVRKRWRTKLAIRGAVGFLVAGVLAIFALAAALDYFRFSPAAIFGFRFVAGALLLAAAGWFFARPMLRKVSDEQVALYLEEHEPTLDNTILTVMAEPGDRAASPSLVRRMIETAVERLHAVEDGARIEREPLRKFSMAVGAVSLVALVLFAFGPALLRQTLSALFVLSRSVEAAAPYRIEVKPGDATVPKGADQAIAATLSGFDAADAAVVYKKGAESSYERVAMLKGEDGSYEGLLFDLSDNLEYFVEAAGVRSPVFTLKVVELPYVKKLDLEYRFPSYTGLEPRKVEDGGDIAVLAGTDVALTVTPTMATRGGRVVIGDSDSVTLASAADGTLTASFTAKTDGFYRIELDAPSGERVTASPQYTIDILKDQTPTVAVSKPGRDSDATPVQEFAVEVKADDDYAVRNLELVYSVNGGPEKTIKLLDGRKPLQEVTAGHTFYLEELGVQAGDAVSYYARATDNNAVQGPQRATSDMYFLRVRPFNKDFKPAMSMGGGGGGGGGGMDQVGALSQQQRQIVAGTFNMQRDRKQMAADKFREGMTVLTLSQSRLREQVEGLVERMSSRLVAPDPAFQKIAELLPQAAESMKAAEGKLQGQSPDGALPPEQRALQLLQQAEEEFELQVQTQRNAGGGGGGGAGSIAEDLADLFQMELDRMANQYETNQRASQQAGDQRIDELAEKLKELARRQEQELERQRRMAAGQAPRGNGNDLQRALAEQAEEAARQLERLSRDQNRQDLANTARQLRDAADAMRRAASNGDGSAQGQAAAAAERLREAQRQLQRSQGDRAGRDVHDALRQAEEIAREQKDIAEDVNDLPNAGADRIGRAQMVGQRKDALEQKVAGLEQQLDRMANETAKDAKDVSRKLAEAANGIRENQLKEKIRYSKRAAQGGAPEEFARNLEAQIGVNVDQLRQTLSQASEAAGRMGQARGPDAVERARDLARNAESLGRRMEERARQGQQGRGQRGEAGQPGQEGQRGQQDQEGQQGQAGQRGQQGQQGQQGQAGQQGQQGQAGQQGQQGQAGQQGQQGGQDGGGQQDGAADGQAGGGDTRGGAWGGGPWGDRRPGDYYTSDDVRQFRGEARRWLGEAQALRNMLREQGVDPKELDEIMRRMRELDSERVYRDVEELARLQTFVAEGIKRFEYNLRRQAGADADRAIVAGAEDVPPEFRALVEEYYRSLSKARPQK